MSETRVRPRLEIEDRPAPRLEALPVVLPEAPRAGMGTIGLAASGAAALIVGLAALQTANFVTEQFERGPVLGGVTLAVALAGFGLIGAAVWREVRGLFTLHSVDRMRRDLLEPARVKQAALRWIAQLPEGQTLASSLAAVEDPAAIAALLRAGPVATLRARADALGRAAAVQVFAAAAAMPSPAFDGLLVGWRGVRLVREVAELHGLHPGLLGTMALLRRTVFAAASVMATDFAVDTATRAVLSNPLLQHLAGDVAAGGVAARRMIVLARATSAACSPLPAT